LIEAGITANDSHTFLSAVPTQRQRFWACAGWLRLVAMRLRGNASDRRWWRAL